MSGFLRYIGIVLIALFSAQPLMAQKDSSGTGISYSSLFQQARQKLYTQPAEAESLFVQILKGSEEHQDYVTYCEAARQLGLFYSNSGKYNAARDLLQKALAIADQKSINSCKADLYYNLGSSFHVQGAFSYAVENYLMALRLFEAEGNAPGKLNTYSSLADVYSRQNNFSKAIEYNLKALKLYEQKNDRFKKLNSYEQLGQIYFRGNDFQKALFFYQKSLKEYQEMGNQAGECATLIKLGGVKSSLGKDEAALSDLNQAIKLAATLKIAPLEIQSILARAKVLAKTKDYINAGTDYRKAASLAKKAGMKIELDEAYEGLTDLYRALNDQSKSKAYQALSNEVKDSLFNDSILKRTADLQLLYDTEKKQAQIEILRREDAIKELDLRQTRQVKNFFIALSVLLVLLILVFIYFITQNRIINKQLKRGMIDLEQKNQEIMKQKEQLSQLNQVKDRFFSIISHDLRNNLTTMKLYFDLVSNPAYDAHSQSEFGKEVAGSVQNTIDLLENLLVWASGQIKGVQVQPARINLYNLAEENCSMLKSMAVQKNISLVNDTDTDACILADHNMVNLILRNLLSNALKFTRDGGSVTILSEEEEDHHKISVIDDGVGISEDKIKTLFTAHINVSTQGTGNEKGTGLGLMLCREFTEKNGGRIWVESEEGKGSSFMLTFPKCN